MKLITAALILATTLGVFSLSASADTLTLVSTGGVAVDGEYIYPYNFSLNGSTTTIPLMCIEFSRQITQGETWNVTANAIPLDNSQASIDRRAMAILLYELKTGYNGNSISDYQFAAWSILDSAALAGKSGYTANAQALAALALTQAAGSGPGFAGFTYTGFTLYVPTSDTTGWTAGQPQELIGGAPAPTPEPSSLALLGTGVLGIGAALRKRFAPRA